MKKSLIWATTLVATLLALYAAPVLAIWRPGHG